MTKKRQIREKGIIILCFAILFVLILCPLAMIFSKAVIQDGCLDLSNAWNTVIQSDNLTTIKNSIALGIVVVVFSTMISAPIAFLLSRTELGRHRFLDIVFMIPFMTPPYISSMGWILFMQKNGLLEQLFPKAAILRDSFFSFWGLAFVMALHVFPFMISILKNAMLNIGSNLEEAGAVFGGGFWYRMRKIMLPLLGGNYAIGALLVFVKTISEYGTPATLGQRIGFYVFTTDIHRNCTTAPIDFSKAASLSMILIGICLFMWYIQNYITTKKSYKIISGKGIKLTKSKLRKSVKISSYAYLGIVMLLSIGIPYFSVVVSSLIKLRGYGLAKGNFTIQAYIDLFTENSKGLNAILTSLFLAVAAASVSSILGTAIATIIRFYKNRWKKSIEAISLLPEMLPGIVIVIGLMLFWNKIYHMIPLYNTLSILVLAYIVLYLPYTVQYVTSSYTQMNENLIKAAKTFGGTSWYTFKRVTLPLILKGAITGWIMTFIISFRELVAASMMAPPNVLTVSTFIVREFEQGSVSIGMAMAVICMVLTTGILVVLKAITENKEARR